MTDLLLRRSRFIRIVPESVFNLPLRQFNRVVFPEPDGPMTARTCPGRTSPLTSLRRCLSPARTDNPLNTTCTGRGVASIRHGKCIADESTL